jgi:replicative DNA helicase
MKINLQQLKVFYDSLGHGDKCTVVHCQDVNNGKFVGRKIVKGWNEFLAIIQSFNGLGNTFASRNPVNFQGECVEITNLTFDLDPENYDKSIGSTPDQIEQCKRAGEAILQAYPGGWLAFSGNGCLASLPFELNWMENSKNFPLVFKKFSETYIKPIVAKYEGVKLDDLYDNERLIKAVGTISCRGEKRQTRFFILPSKREYIAKLQQHVGDFFGSVSALENRENGHSRESVDNSIQPTQPTARIGHPNRQRYLVSLAGSLHRRGLSEAIIFETVKKAYQDNCVLEPIKTDAKLLEIVKSIMKYPNKDGMQGYGALYTEETTVEDSNLEGDLVAYDQYLEERAKFKEPELTTGFKNLDDLCNGYQRGDIFTLGAYTGGGKSTFLVNSMDALCRKGRKVLYLSTEMSKYSIFNKFFSLNTGTNYIVYDKGNFTSEELQKRQEFAKIFKDYPIVVNDSLTLTIDSVKLLMQKVRPDVLVFDHIHEVGNGSQNYYGFLKDFTHGLQLIGRDFNCAVVLAAQFQRPPRLLDATTGQYKKPPKPTTQSIKACGDIENKSRVVALLSDTFTSLYPDKNIMELEIAKCSKGSKGICRLNWEWKLSKFSEQEG